MIEVIFGIFVYIISFILNYICLCKICSKRIKLNPTNILIIIVISLVNYYSTKIEIILIKSFISFISSFIILRIIVHEDEKRSLICTLLFMLIVSVIEILCSLFIVGILKVIPLEYVTSTSYTKNIIGLLILGIIYIVCSLRFIKNYYNKLCEFANHLNISNEYILLLFFMLSIIITFYVIYIVGQLKLVYSILYLTIFVVFIFYIAVSLYKNYYLKLINKYLLNKEDEYIKLLDEYKMFKHNIKNEFYVIKSVNNKKVNKIIDEYNNEFETNDKTVKISSLFPKSMRSLIYNKIINTETNIAIDNYISSDPINILSLRIYMKMIESVGILIDNAIDETRKDKDGYIYMLLQENDYEYIIKISNSLLKKEYDMDVLCSKGQSTKKNHEGIGLSYIKNKTPFKLYTSICNNLFNAKIIIKK